MEVHMRWPLILRLSLFGLVMAFATLSFLPPALEPLLWLAIFVACAYWLAKGAPTKLFLHGLVLGLANSVWITAVHAAFLGVYLAHHPAEAAMMKSMPMPSSPRLMMALVGPVVGGISGTIIGLLAMGVAAILRRGQRAPHASDG